MNMTREALVAFTFVRKIIDLLQLIFLKRVFVDSFIWFWKRFWVFCFCCIIWAIILNCLRRIFSFNSRNLAVLGNRLHVNLLCLVLILLLLLTWCKIHVARIVTSKLALMDNLNWVLRFKHVFITIDTLNLWIKLSLLCCGILLIVIRLCIYLMLKVWNKVWTWV